MIKRLTACVLMLAVGAAAHAQSLRFFGSGTGDADRVKIRADSSSIPANIGATDITIEFWMKSAAGDNAQPQITPGANYNWINGNIIFDRDRYNQVRGHGVSLTGGAITFGVNLENGQRTWRTTTNLRDGQWHHVAIQRSTSGAVQIYIDGEREVNDTGPSGSLAYPNGATPGNFCGPSGSSSCANSDPFIVIGAEKHDVDPVDYPAFRGHFTELRLSTTLRYTGASFAVPTAPFSDSAANTAALYHFDHGTAGTNCDTAIVDSMGGASNGICKFGGAGGPQWSADSPFAPNPGTLRFTSATFSAAENGGAAAITVERTGGSQGAATVSVNASGGTATQGADYTLPQSSTLSWADGDSAAKTFSVSVIDDSAPESAETLQLQLTNATGAALGSRTQTTLTITDNDGDAAQVLQFSSPAASINESGGSVQLTVARTGTSGSVTANYATSNGTAASGSDYVAASGTLTFADGEQSKQITITINNDASVEPDETFTVTLSSPAGATLGANAAATVTISNDDAAPTPQPQPPPSSSGGGGGGGSLGALVVALGLLLTARGRRERARA